jgi:hypothetical protein
MAEALKLVVHAVHLGVRPLRLRLPFRFGAHTLTACPQLFVRVEAEVAGLGRATGFAAELMVPKWFDKRPGFMLRDNVGHLAQAAANAAAAYRGDSPATPFELFARHHAALAAAGREQGLTELSSAFGPAVLDRAVIDAVCRAANVSFFDAARHNLLGIDSRLTPELSGWDWAGWLRSLQPLQQIEARHTVGLLDELEAVRYGDDGLPVSLRAVIERYGHRCFKIKLSGDPDADLARLRAVHAVLAATVGDHRHTLDGNEQYTSLDALGRLLAGLRDMPAPLYIEQPVPRESSFGTQLPAGDFAPFLMDEADATLDAFARGRATGWTGVSSKGCKGIYKALLNRARCVHWNREMGAPTYFMSAEDLTCQAGLAVQQDLALVALLGISHSERNGHHYGAGFGDAPAAEQAAFVSTHPDLYDGAGRLRIDNGSLRIGSLAGAGFAHGADPDWSSLQALASAADAV